MSGGHPTHLYTPMLPCTSVCSRGYLHVIWGRYHMLESGGSAHLSGILVSVSTCNVLSLWIPAYWSGYLDVCYASCCFFLVVYYLSSLYHYGYNYYSSSDCGVFWYVISFISYHGSLFDGASCNMRSVWCGSATTIDTEVPWRCYWPCLCATAANSIFDAFQAYANYAMGSPRVGFFFRVEPPTVLYIIRWCLFWYCFLLSSPILDAIFTPGGWIIGVCTIATPWILPMAGICATWQWLLAHIRYAQSGCSLHYLE